MLNPTKNHKLSSLFAWLAPVLAGAVGDIAGRLSLRPPQRRSLET